MKNQIDIIPSHGIDKVKWDRCIRNSSHPLIYACSFYLDHIADNWHGIVANDYETVMPVAWRKKMGVRYCYDVPFIQQLGWYSSANEMVYSAEMIKALFSFCRYGDYSFRYKNNITQTKASAHTNYIIDLSQPYGAIAAHYKTDLDNNLKKAERESFVYAAENAEAAIDIFKDLYSGRVPHVSADDYSNFKKLVVFLKKNNAAFAKKVCSKNNELLAVALLLKDETRVYNMMNSTTAAGRKTGANHFLFANIFKEFAGSPLVFDFEGSDIAGVKNFYEKFGAANQPYFKIHFNHLPFPANLIK